MILALGIWAHFYRENKLKSEKNQAQSQAQSQIDDLKKETETLKNEAESTASRLAETQRLLDATLAALSGKNRNSETPATPATQTVDVDLELANESQRAAATKVADALRERGLFVSDIAVGHDTPPDTQVRYFWDSNRTEAQTILTIIQRDFRVMHSRLSRNLTSTSGRHYEIWFAKDAF